MKEKSVRQAEGIDVNIEKDKDGGLQAAGGAPNIHYSWRAA